MAKARALNRIAVIADCHIGNHAQWGGHQVNGLNARCRVAVDALTKALVEAERMGVKVLFVAGDLFHSRRPEPAVIAAVQEAFDAVSGSMMVILVPGNHDMLDASAAGGNTACAPVLGHVGAVVSTPGWYNVGPGPSVLCVPYSAERPMAAYLEQVLCDDGIAHALPKGADVHDRVLVTHVGVWSETSPPWMRRAKDGISAERLSRLMTRARLRVAFVGNYHEHRVWNAWDRTIVQVGTLCPGGFGDAGTTDRGLMVTSDGTDLFNRHEVPGPRFIVLGPNGGRAFGENENTYYVRQVGGDPMDAAVVAKLGGYELVGDRVKVLEAVGQRAQPQSPMEALEAHVEMMEVGDLVDRGTVLDLVKECWTRGA